ncbi:MAG: hypothetical protein L6R38_007051 [Xanthoria sp. 2 TBL-2021]|nr:MAG: hypothetical protein L6R38_007051 [Xanthoria sp. 2 TBL-2021]
MGIEIAARASSETGLEIFPSFVVEHPTIGDLRNVFARPTTSTPHSEPISEFCLVASTPESTEDHVSASDSEDIVMVQSPVEDVSPAPNARITLMQGHMCCPRPVAAEDKSEVGWRIYQSIASQGGLWNASDTTQQHLRAIFASVANYHPPPMTAEELPRRTAIIWGKKGLIDRCSRDDKLMQLLADRDIPTEPFVGFMEHAKMGAIAWGLPHKTDADLGPNGWDRYVGEALCVSIDADHLEMPMPGHVHLLHGAMEEAFTYLRGPND